MNLSQKALDPRVASQRIWGFRKPWPSVRPAYDGDNPYADFDGSGALTNRYLYGPGIDQLIARADAIGAGSISDGIDWYLTDILGSVRQLVQSGGTVSEEPVFAVIFDGFLPASTLHAEHRPVSQSLDIRAEFPPRVEWRRERLGLCRLGR